MKERDQRKISPEMAHFYHVNFMRDNERKIADIKRKVSDIYVMMIFFSRLRVGHHRYLLLIITFLADCYVIDSY